MQYIITFNIECKEDAELLEYVQNTLTNRNRIPQNKHIRPTEFVYKSLNRRQRKIYDLLYDVEKCECPICYDEITQHTETVLDCKHKFCKSCLDELQTRTNICPCCRHKIEYFVITFTGPYHVYMILVFVHNLFAIYSKKRPKDKLKYPPKTKFDNRRYIH